MPKDIAKIDVVTRYKRFYDFGYYHSGNLLTMKDGTKWFHPFDGSASYQVKE